VADVTCLFAAGSQAGVDYPARWADLRSWFSTDADCLDYLEWLRWPDGFCCPHCGGTRAWRGVDGAELDEIKRLRSIFIDELMTKPLSP
jgi:hypothetical protein